MALNSSSPSPTRKQKASIEEEQQEVPPSPYRVGNWTVTKLKEELKQRSLSSTGRKLDLIERLEEADRTPILISRKTGREETTSEVGDETVEKVLAKMTVAQLQDELLRRGLSPVGKKTELVARLAYDDLNFPASSSSPRGRTRSPVRSSPTTKGSPKKALRSPSPAKTVVHSESKSTGDLKFWCQPVETFTHLGLAFAEKVNCCVGWLKKEPMTMVSVLALIALVVLVDRLEGVHQTAWRLFVQTFSWLLGWFLNGLISSVTLGANGNGFPMFLGPFIAKVTTTAFYCKSVDFPLFGKDAYKCGSTKFPAVSFVNIFIKATWPLFAYGMGVVIGQIPLYLLANCTGNALIAAMHSRPLAIKRLEALSFRAKYILLLISAMMPNPFFDIARVYFGLRDWFTMEDFFFASMLGKFFVKTVSEALFVILMFSTAHLQRITGFLRNGLGVPQSIVRYVMAWVGIQRGLLEPSLEPLQFDALVWAWQGVILVTAVTLLITLINATATAHKLKKSH